MPVKRLWILKNNLKSKEMKQLDLESPVRWWHNDSYETHT